jgi:hypothetical protein
VNKAIVDVSNLGWVPTAVARKRLGVTRQRVYQLVRTGVLASCKQEGVTLISVASIDARIRSIKRMEQDKRVRL